MKITGTRFNTIEYDNEDVITFSDGLIGFPESKRFVVVNARPDTPFRWLQSLDEPTLAFLVVEPAAYVPDYQPELSQGSFEQLGLSEDAPKIVFTTAAIPQGKPYEMTINLMAPIVVNPLTNKASQVVLEDAAYTMKHPVFPSADRVGQDAAA